MIRIESDISGLEEQLTKVVFKATLKAVEEQQRKSAMKEWLSLKEAASYANVSYNTFIKFRELGLRVAEIQGVKRVSKREIDRFLETNSF